MPAMYAASYNYIVSGYQDHGGLQHTMILFWKEKNTTTK